MGLFLLFTIFSGIAALLFSSLAYSFGFYSFGDLSSWLGWGGLSFFIFAIFGIGFKNTQLYVNSGTGYWGIPWRYRTPPEITHLKLMIDIELRSCE